MHYMQAYAEILVNGQNGLHEVNVESAVIVPHPSSLCIVQFIQSSSQNLHFSDGHQFLQSDCWVIGAFDGDAMMKHSVYTNCVQGKRYSNNKNALCNRKQDGKLNSE